MLFHILDSERRWCNYTRRPVAVVSPWQTFGNVLYKWYVFLKAEVQRIIGVNDKWDRPAQNELLRSSKSFGLQAVSCKLFCGSSAESSESECRMKLECCISAEVCYENRCEGV